MGGDRPWIDQRTGGGVRPAPTVVAPGQRLSADGALDGYLRIPFTLPADELRTAMDRLAAGWAELG